jgi:hypothetical protein
VHGGDTEVGRAVALHLSAAGTAVLVTGADERALGRCVGEIVFGGGKGRHVVAGAATDEAIAACARAAVERFGRLDVAVVVGGPDDALRASRAAGVPAFAADPAADADATAVRLADEIARSSTRSTS